MLQAIRLLWVAFTVVALSAPHAHAQDTDAQTTSEQALISAYQREFVFLDNEIRLLQGRLDEVRASGETRLSDARNRLRELESRLIRLRGDVDRRQEDLRLLQSESEETRTADDSIDRVIEQASQRLADYGIPAYSEPTANEDLSPAERRGAELDYVFDSSFEAIDQWAGFRRTEGSFFLEDGTEAEGDIVHIGRIAAFGTAESVGGTLAPAGEGYLRLIDRDTLPTARELRTESGESRIDVLPVFLFESLTDAADIDQGTSFRETVEASGIIGLVIIAIGAAALILIVLRSAILIAVGRGAGGGERGVARLVADRDFAAAKEKAASLPGAMGRVLLSTVRGLETGGDGIEDVISEAVLNEQPNLDRFRSALGVFAAVAPLLGLLGTVTGMITTFDVITQFGTGDPKLLSGGISEALITTEFGLAVAIPTLLVGNLLSSWSDRVTSNLEVSALRLVNTFSGYESSSLKMERN